MAGKPLPNLARLVDTKDGREWIKWLWNHKCKHRQNYLRHFGCYQTEHPGGPIPERIGYLDIESTEVRDARFGMVLCWCIKPAGRPVIGELVRPKEARHNDDRRILQKLIKRMMLYDRLVVHYGGDRRFDLPFLRSRCIYQDIEFPEYHKPQIWIRDTWVIARRKLKLNSNRLESVADLCRTKIRKTRLEPEVWVRAGHGDKEALQVVYKHCEIDVKVLEKVDKKIGPFVPPSRTSI